MKSRQIAFCAIALFALCRPAGARNFTNLFDYCAAVGTIDRPDSRFAGPYPTRGAAAAFSIDPAAIRDGAFAWRCMGGAVFACAQLNSPICGKADTAATPTPAMTAYCRANPTSEVIPLVVMGHEHPSAYDWTCREGRAIPGRRLFTPDPRGYPPDLWRKLSRPTG